MFRFHGRVGEILAWSVKIQLSFIPVFGGKDLALPAMGIAAKDLGCPMTFPERVGEGGLELVTF